MGARFLVDRPASSSARLKFKPLAERLKARLLLSINLKGFFASFLRPNSNYLINRDNKDSSIAYLFGAGRTKDRVHRPLNPSVRNHNFKFHFGHESAIVLGP